MTARATERIVAALLMAWGLFLSASLTVPRMVFSEFWPWLVFAVVGAVSLWVFDEEWRK